MIQSRAEALVQIVQVGKDWDGEFSSHLNR